MKSHIQVFLLLAFSAASCFQNKHKPTTIATSNQSAATDDSAQIKTLIKAVYKWHDKDSSQNEMDPIADNKGRRYTGMNFDKHRLRLDELRKTGFFSDTFINNYDKIVKGIDDKMRTGDWEWQVGDLPPFGNDANPWCDCQDYPSANWWDKMVFSFIDVKNDKATVNWTWGDEQWSKDFKYTVRVVKANGVWQIEYMERFDLAKYTQ